MWLLQTADHRATCNRQIEYSLSMSYSMPNTDFILEWMARGTGAVTVGCEAIVKARQRTIGPRVLNS